MARGLTLKRFELRGVDFDYLGAFRLRIEASDPGHTGADPNVFVYLQRPPSPYDGVVKDDLHAVASPVDLTIDNVGEPAEGTEYPWLRRNYLEIDLRAAQLADEVWQTVVREVNQLLKSLDIMDNLVMVEETDVGAPHTDDNGSSGSSSTSA